MACFYLLDDSNFCCCALLSHNSNKQVWPYMFVCCALARNNKNTDLASLRPPQTCYVASSFSYLVDLAIPKGQGEMLSNHHMLHCRGSLDIHKTIRIKLIHQVHQNKNVVSFFPFPIHSARRLARQQCILPLATLHRNATSQQAS
jgi:hypothetical protein